MSKLDQIIERALEKALGEEAVPGAAGQSDSILSQVMGKPVLVETATRFFSGVMSATDGVFVKVTECQWVADTGKYSSYHENPEGDSNAEFEPCADQYISIGAICTLSVLPKVIRKLK
jgi:hypothetical protein